jgi:hypothetical protein
MFMRRLFIPAFEIDAHNIEHFIEEIREHRPVLVDGYAESLNFLATYVREGGRPGFSPKAIMSSAQGLPDNVRTIYYTLNGTDPRASGGVPSASAKIYDGPITLTSQSHLFARAKEKNLWSSPTLADFRVEQNRSDK